MLLGLSMSLVTGAAPLLAGFFLSHGWLPIFPQEAASVGIIGGADGPTAIFISSAPGLSPGLKILLWLSAALLGFFLYRRLRYVKKD